MIITMTVSQFNYYLRRSWIKWIKRTDGICESECIWHNKVYGWRLHDPLGCIKLTEQQKQL